MTAIQKIEPKIDDDDAKKVLVPRPKTCTIALKFKGTLEKILRNFLKKLSHFRRNLGEIFRK